MAFPSRLVIPAGYVQASFHHATAIVGRDAVVTMGFAPPDPLELSDVEALYVDWQGLVENLMNTTIAFTSVSVADTGGLLWEVPGDAVGEASGDAMTPNVTYLVKKSAAGSGRRRRGRMYLPGVRENLVDAGGSISSVNLAVLQGLVDTLYDDFVAGGWDPYILHSTTEADPTPGDVPAPTPVSSFIFENMVATQRRRLRG